jgi:hypothetical protein
MLNLDNILGKIYTQLHTIRGLYRPSSIWIIWFTIWALHLCLQFTTKCLGMALKPLHGWVLTRTDAVWVLSSWPVPQYRCTTGDNSTSCEQGMSSDAGLANWSITIAAANTWHTCWPCAVWQIILHLSDNYRVFVNFTFDNHQGKLTLKSWNKKPRTGPEQRKVK